MLYTSAQANKYLKTLHEQHNDIIVRERQAKTFVAAISEDLESARPDYSFLETQDELLALEKKIREVKHAINLFNVSYHIKELDDMTIDEVLVYIPQLTIMKRKLSEMVKTLPKKRHDSGFGTRSNIVEYEYTNYNISNAQDMFNSISDRLSKAQLALDLANTIPAIELDI